MTQWMMWATAAGLLVILELFSGTFYLLMIAIGMAFGAVAAYAGLASGMQLLIAAAVGAATTVTLNRSKFGKMSRTNSARDPNVNLDIGQSINVDHWTMRPDGSAFARVLYRGAQWDVDYAGAGTALPGAQVITEIRGSRLLVAPHSTTLHSTTYQ